MGVDDNDARLKQRARLPRRLPSTESDAVSECSGMPNDTAATGWGLWHVLTLLLILFIIYFILWIFWSKLTCLSTNRMKRRASDWSDCETRGSRRATTFSEMRRRSD